MNIKFKNGAPIGCRGIVFFIWLFIITCWIFNFIKLLNCDFETPFKEEVIHLIGVFIPPASIITCWL